MDALVIKGLKKTYGDTVALDGVSFSIKDGEVFGLIGPNGAGKTTTLRIISTLLTMTDGQVTVYGKDIKTEPEEVRKMISYLPEDSGAYKDLSGIGYLKFMAAFFADGKEYDEMVERGVQISNLGDRLKSKVSTYSKGMMRRLLIARAIMPNPKLAIMDEITSGLDVMNAFEIRELIKGLAKEGVSVLISSHNMFEVDQMCDRIAMVNHGKIVLEGSPKELKERYNVDTVEQVFIKAVKDE